MPDITDGSTSVCLTRYIDRGWHVFPCHTAIDGGCSCGKPGCEHVGKHPRTMNGLKDATCDPVQVSRWWPVNASTPSNIAIATGKASGIVVIDVDVRHDGAKTKTDLELELGRLPIDAQVLTGGGGWHFYFRYPQGTCIKSRNGWRQGIDIKADGGYVVAPPSVHESRKRYDWCGQGFDRELPELPVKWLEALCAPNEATAVERTVVSDSRSILLQRAQRYAASVPGAAEGSRNQSAFGLAGHIAAFVDDAGSRLGESDILGVVQSWNTRCNPPLADSEVAKCVSSALTNGKPRTNKEIHIFDDTPVADDYFAGNEDIEEPTARKSQATLLVEVSDGVDLFHDADGEAYVRIPVDDDEDFHWEVVRVRTRPFKRWLSRRFYRVHGKVPSAQAMQDALGIIEARAVYDGDKRDVAIRIAEKDGCIYFDLANDRWQVVEIDKAGWRILDESPVMFRRPKAMFPLPTPSSAGDVGLLREFANVTDEDWPLVLAWLVAAMRPVGPYPVLAVYGEHGSGKSGLCRRLRSLVDPNRSPLRGDYREPRDLMVCANSGWVVALDNLSTIQPWLSDCFCRLSTGGGFSCRTLYENDEETIFAATRPLLLNCIEEIVSRSDLLDRCVLVNLPRIDQRCRLPEKELDRRFDAARPHIFGGLLSAISSALRQEDSISLPTLPRMADFAIWATAAEPALGLGPGQFMSTYQSNRDAGNETAIEASPIGKPLVDFATAVGDWSGTSTELLGELQNRTDEATRKLKSWPNTPKTLGGIVKRLAPNLRDAGIAVEFRRKGRKGARTISLAHQQDHLGKTSSAPSASSAPHEPAGICGFVADDGADDRQRGSSSAETMQFLGENGHADATDDADAEFPDQSTEPAWSEL